MGTKVQNLPGYYSMRDLNEESSSCGWPLFYGDKTLANGQYYHNYMSSATTDACSAYDKAAVKQTMLEHEAIFKDQVFELHRLYRIQRDLMDEVKMKELHGNQIPVETSFSTGPLASKITSEDGKKWHITGFPIGSAAYARTTSISGVEGICSPLGSSKGTNKQANLFPSPNGSSSKDLEVLEPRPSKLRRKMFDLHLPGDEYIDPEESDKLSDEKISGTTIFLPESNCKQAKGVDVKPFFCNGGKTGSQEDSSRPEQFSRSRTCLADLNEPVQVEEINDAACVPFPNHNPYQEPTECSDLSSKLKSSLFGLSREDLLSSHHGTDSWARNNGYLDNNGSGKGWFSSVLEAGQANSSLKPIPQVLKQEQSLLSFQTMKDVLSKAHEPAYDYQSNQSKADFWREKTVSCLDTSERNHEFTTNKHPELIVSSHRPGFFAIASPSDLSKSGSHSTTLEMASSNLSQKLVSVQTVPSLSASGALSRSSQSHQSNGIKGDSWPINVNSKLNQGFQYKVPVQNGFHPGSSSQTKELSVNISSISYDCLNHNNDCKRIPELFNNGSAKHYKNSNSCCIDMTSGKDINLNVMLSNGSSDNLVTQSELGIMHGEQKHEEQLPALPWLRAKSTCKREAQNAGRSLTAGDLILSEVATLSIKDESSKGSNGKFLQSVMSGLCSNDIEPKRTEISEGSSKRKILGVPIFGMPHVSPKESFPFASPTSSVPNPSGVELVENNQKEWVLDINLPCYDDVIELDSETNTEIIVSKKGSPTREANSRNQIDLNLSMSEDEEFLMTIPTTEVKKKAEIDLESPAVPEIEEHVIPKEKQQLDTPLVLPSVLQETGEQQQDEVIKHAAEAIVAISSLCCNQVDDVISSIPPDSPMVDPLGWFVDFISSCVDDPERKSDGSREKDGEESSSGGMDYFECMTLKLTETKEEDYMPKPLVPENFKVEETGTTSLTTRARKGSARRGRQRRDFQRDILPGLASLSRHEVTEDIQIFGGLMRATGHSWQSGLTRRSSSRNGCGRGRRRLQVAPSPPPPPVATIETCTPLIQQLNTIEVGLEDRSLTGWGKTTRRPRRQRCPAGNPPSIRLI